MPTDAAWPRLRAVRARATAPKTSDTLREAWLLQILQDNVRTQCVNTEANIFVRVLMNATGGQPREHELTNLNHRLTVTHRTRAENL